MSNTHIIIPIKDLTEEVVKALVAYKSSKLISLDEKDIKEKADKWFIEEILNKEISYTSSKELLKGYNQALKDLL